MFLHKKTLVRQWGGWKPNWEENNPKPALPYKGAVTFSFFYQASNPGGSFALQR